MSILERVDAHGVDEPGIEPVPPEARTLSALDLAVLWGDLGIGLLVLVTGALLVPGLGLPAALAAIVIGSVIGVTLLALGGAAGAETGVPTMVLFRPVLGLRGSWIPSVLNALQLVGWTAVELWAMSFVADRVSREVFGFSARPLWLLIAAAVCGGLALWGPVGVTRIWMERFGAWVIVGLAAGLTVAVVVTGDLGAVLSRPGGGGFPTFGAAIDLVVVMPISWLPLVADYNRFGRGPRPAFLGTFWGYLVANVWLYTLGALLVLQAGAAPSPAGIAAGVLAVAGGSVAGILFLVALLVGETDEAFADIYSAAVSIQNIWPRARHRVLVIAVVVVGSALAAGFTMQRYEAFLFLLGSVFVPLFGVLIADHFAKRRRHLALDELYRPDSRYWFTRGVRLAALVPWAAGFAVYHWISPSPLEWWSDAVRAVVGTPLGERFVWLNASLPSFAIAFLAALCLPSPEGRKGSPLQSPSPSDR